MRFASGMSHAEKSPAEDAASTQVPFRRKRLKAVQCAVSALRISETGVSGFLATMLRLSAALPGRSYLPRIDSDPADPKG